MLASIENGTGYNPAFLKKVREKQRAAKLAAERSEMRARELREQIAKAEARLKYEERQRQENAHQHFIEYNVIPIDRTTIRSIIRSIGAAHGVTPEEIVGRRRSRNLTKVRDMCIRAAADARPDLSLPSIGRIFNRDHTTILHSLRKTRKPGQPR